MSEFPWNKILSAYHSDIVVAEAEIRRHKMEADKYEKERDWYHVNVYREYEAVARWRKRAAEYTYEHLRKQKYEAQKRANMEDATEKVLGEIETDPLVEEVIRKDVIRKDADTKRAEFQEKLLNKIAAHPLITEISLP